MSKYVLTPFEPSSKNVGSIVFEYVSGTTNSSGVATVNTSLTTITGHMLSYFGNGAAKVDAIDVGQVSSGTVTVKGTASSAFSGFIYGYVVLQ